MSVFIGKAGTKALVPLTASCYIKTARCSFRLLCAQGVKGLKAENLIFVKQLNI